ncbi:hypothetical protein [Streptomyces sp. 4F14]|uniref:hypothetical protein n=1 Tax=Streptomyces sp. 4F14 TaxID=3394380 RepID=UPI003A84AD7F
MESEEEPPEEEVRPLEPELVVELLELSEFEELSVVELELSVVPDESLVPLDELPLLLDELLLEPAVVSAPACIVPTSANIPAAAASVSAAARAAVRLAPLRTAEAAPRSSSLVVMAVPLRGDVLSRTTVGERPERSL